MSNYEAFKSEYNRRSEPGSGNDWKKAIRKSRSLRRSMLATQVILGITAGVLLYFFYYLSAYRVAAVSVALLTMIGVLILRVVLEFISMKWLQRLEYTAEFVRFRSGAETFHRFRRAIQFGVTPVLYLVYFGGFIVLLPYFKESLSAGFYRYILISGATVFIILGLIIAKEIRKEIKVLKFMMRTSMED